MIMKVSSKPLMPFKSFALLLFFFLALALIILFSLSGCNTYKKQVAKYHSFSYAHPEEAAKDCATLFPVRDSIGRTIVDSTKKADNRNYINEIDSLKGVADMLKLKVDLDTGKSNPCGVVAKKYQSTISQLTFKIDALKNAYRPCKPDTVYKTQTIYRTDVAALTVEQNKNKVISDSLVIYKTMLKAETDTAHSWRKYALIAFGIIGLSILGTILKFMGKI